MQPKHVDSISLKKSLSALFHCKWRRFKDTNQIEQQTKEIDDELNNLEHELEYLTKYKDIIADVVAKDCRGVPMRDVVRFQQNSRIFFTNHNQPIYSNIPTKLPCHIVSFYQQPGRSCICRSCPQDKAVPPDDSFMPRSYNEFLQQSAYGMNSQNRTASQAVQVTPQQNTISATNRSFESTPIPGPTNLDQTPTFDWTMIGTPAQNQVPMSSINQLYQSGNVTQSPLPPDWTMLQQTSQQNQSNTGYAPPTSPFQSKSVTYKDAANQNTLYQDEYEEFRICVPLDALSSLRNRASVKMSPCLTSKDCPCTVLTEKQIQELGGDIEPHEENHKKGKEKKTKKDKKKKEKKSKEKKAKEEKAGCCSFGKKKKQKPEAVQNGVQAAPVTDEKTQQVPMRPYDYLQPTVQPVKVTINPMRQCDPQCPDECASAPVDCSNPNTVCQYLKDFVKKNSTESAQYLKDILEELKEQRKELQKINQMYETCIRNISETKSLNHSNDSYERSNVTTTTNNAAALGFMTSTPNGNKNSRRSSPNKKLTFPQICKCYNNADTFKKFRNISNESDPFAAEYVVSSHWMYFDPPNKLHEIFGSPIVYDHPKLLLEAKKDLQKEDTSLNKLIIRNLRNVSTSTKPVKNEKVTKPKKLDLALVWIKHSVNSLRRKYIRHNRAIQASIELK